MGSGGLRKSSWPLEGRSFGSGIGSVSASLPPASLDTPRRTESHVTRCKQTIGVTLTRHSCEPLTAPFFRRKTGEQPQSLRRSSAHLGSLSSRTQRRLSLRFALSCTSASPSRP